MKRALPWIPPEPLVFAQASLIVSWGLLYAAGTSGAFGPSPLGLAWVHAVVLGWLTSTALAFLIHVLPTFTGVALRFERLARVAMWVFQAGVICIVVGFASWTPYLLSAGGALVVIAIALVLSSFLATAVEAMRRGGATTRAVARAFSIVFSILGVTVVIGFALSIRLSQGRSFVLSWVGVHAALGVIGWLSLLVAGVSARTYNVLLGRAIGGAAHIGASFLALLGLAIWIAGIFVGSSAVSAAGGAFLAAAALVYLGSTAVAAASASVEHRLPREFVAASAFWLCVAVAYGIAGLTHHGVPAAMLLAILLGWVGQNVNAHMMHVGIRLLATLVLGDDDETRPIVLLDRRLGIISFVFAQTAVACGICGLTISNSALLEAAAITGLLGTLAMLANVARAARAATARKPIDLRGVTV